MTDWRDLLPSNVSSAWIADSIGDEIIAVERIERGNLNQKFFLHLNDGSFVLKVYSDLKDGLPSTLPARRAQREFDTLKSCRRHELRAPMAIDVRGDALLMTKAPGEPLDDLESVGRYAESLAGWLATFHARHSLMASEAQGAVVNSALSRAVAKIVALSGTEPDNRALPSILEVLMNCPPELSADLVQLRGDATLRNWLGQDGQVVGLDFEFSNPGHPIFDIGLLAASILDRGHFTEGAFKVAERVIGMYLGRRALQTIGLNIGILCGLSLIATHIKDQARRGRILSNALKSSASFSNWS